MPLEKALVGVAVEVWTVVLTYAQGVDRMLNNHPNFRRFEAKLTQRHPLHRLEYPRITHKLDTGWLGVQVMAAVGYTASKTPLTLTPFAAALR